VWAVPPRWGVAPAALRLIVVGNLVYSLHPS
jgi:hypothetical protein